MSDVLTAFDLNQQMVQKARDLDDAVREYKEQALAYANAVHDLALKQATSRPETKKQLGPKATVDDIRAALYVQFPTENLEEIKTEALRNGADKAFRAATAQLSALQSQAGALKEELRLARTDNYTGGP